MLRLYVFLLKMMEETNEIEELDFYDGKPAGERWAPLGANDLDDETTCYIQNNSRYVCFRKSLSQGQTVCVLF